MSWIWAKIIVGIVFVLIPGFTLKENFNKHPFLTILSLLLGIFLLFLSIKPLVEASNELNYVEPIKKEIVEIRADIADAFILLNGKTVGMIDSEMKASFEADIGNHQIEINKISEDGLWHYYIIKNIYVGKGSHLIINLKLNKKATEKKKSFKKQERKILTLKQKIVRRDSSMNTNIDSVKTDLTNKPPFIQMTKIPERRFQDVTIHTFELGIYEVTQKQWREVMGNNPSYFNSCDNCPVERVSWDEVQLFIRSLNRKTGETYRLPTETEWEYACRSSGVSQTYCGGENARQLGWYSSNSSRKTHPVGKKLLNGFGLFDMSGNVWEWVQDCWHSDYVHGSKNLDTLLDRHCEKRVIRGGSWFGGSFYMRSTSRRGVNSTNNQYLKIGFRLARNH